MDTRCVCGTPVVQGRVSGKGSGPGQQIAEAKFLDCRKDQHERIFNMPQRQAHRHNSQGDMEDTPEANNIAKQRLLPERMLCFLNCAYMLISAGIERTGAS